MVTCLLSPCTSIGPGLAQATKIIFNVQVQVSSLPHRHWHGLGIKLELGTARGAAVSVIQVHIMMVSRSESESESSSSRLASARISRVRPKLESLPRRRELDLPQRRELDLNQHEDAQKEWKGAGGGGPVLLYKLVLLLYKLFQMCDQNSSCYKKELLLDHRIKQYQ